MFALVAKLGQESFEFIDLFVDYILAVVKDQQYLLSTICLEFILLILFQFEPAWVIFPILLIEKVYQEVEHEVRVI